MTCDLDRQHRGST